MSKSITITVELPTFYCEDIPATVTEDWTVGEQVEEAMCLHDDQVTVTFVCHDGDDPGHVLRSMEGRIVGFGLRRNEGGEAS